MAAKLYERLYEEGSAPMPHAEKTIPPRVSEITPGYCPPPTNRMCVCVRDDDDNNNNKNNYDKNAGL